MASRIPTLKNISVVQCAILISLSKELKREILCVPGSEYDECKSKYQYYRKKQWNAIIVRKAKEILSYQQLPVNLQEKVISILPAIGLRMLLWAEYHEGTLGLTRYYSLSFLRKSHFTFEGLIDNKKVAEEMIKDVNLSIKQLYKLACIYCFTNHIFTFFKAGVVDEESLTISPDCKWMQKPKIVKFWTFRLTGRVDEENQYTPRYLNMLVKSINSGSKEAVKYSLEKTGGLYRENALIYGVTEVLKQISLQRDWIVFRDQRYDDSKESWVPDYFYLDILCFLLSNMTEAQQKKALEKNINGYETGTSAYVQITVLEMLLRWPYQKYFMKTARLLWHLMPQEIYPYILFEIAEKIGAIGPLCEPRERYNVLCGEDKSYDYKKLLTDFWSESPDIFKRFTFTSKLVDYWDDIDRPIATRLVLILISAKTFTHEDEEIIRLIISSATVEEKANLTSSEWWRLATRKMLQTEKFEFFDRLMLVFCKSDEETRDFKKKLDLFNTGRSVLYYFLKYSKINAVKSLIQWMPLSESELLSIKEDIIFSSDGMQYCRKLLLYAKYEDFEECIKWFLPSKEKATELKKALALNINENSHADCFPVHNFDEKDVLNFMARFTRSNLPNPKAIEGIQTSVADIFGRTICEDLIAGSSFEAIYEEKKSLLRVKTKFTGGQWERVDEFLRWSLSTEEEIFNFKATIFKVSGVDIHFQLIKAKQWKEAKRFFNWLRLSGKEIKDLKKRTLHGDPGWMMFHDLVFGGDEMDNLETIDLFLRWNLTDKISVIKFRDVFIEAHENFDESRVMKLTKMIDNYLDELDQDSWDLFRWNPEERFLMKLEAASSKRKSTVPFPQKKKRKEEIHIGNTGNSSKRRSQRLLNRVKKV